MALVAVVAFAVAGCVPGGSTSPGDGEPETAGVEGSHERLAPAELASLLAAGDPWLVNVHVPYEGEIEGTDAFIAYDRIGERIDELPSDRDAAIVVYCRTGRMSSIAAETLVGMGYTGIRELDGGFEAWRAAGLPLIEDPERSTSYGPRVRASAVSLT